MPASEMNFDADESRDILEGRHELSLAWAPVDPFAVFQKSSTRRVVIDVTTVGSCSTDFECGYPQADVNLTLELPDEDRSLEFSGIAYLRNGRAVVHAKSERSAAE